MTENKDAKTMSNLKPPHLLAAVLLLKKRYNLPSKSKSVSKINSYIRIFEFQVAVTLIRSLVKCSCDNLYVSEVQPLFELSFFFLLFVLYHFILFCSISKAHTNYKLHNNLHIERNHC